MTAGFSSMDLFPKLGTIRRRMVVPLVLTIVPLSGLALALAVHERGEEDARARAEENETVRMARTGLDRLFDLSRNLVGGLSRNTRGEDVCGSLNAWGHSFPEFFNIGIFDLPQGSVRATPVCGAVRLPKSSFALNPEGLRLVRGMGHQGDIAVASVSANLLNGRPIITVGGLLEILPDGTRRIVYVSIDLEWLNRQMNQIRLPDNSVMVVLDRNGRVVAHNPFSKKYSPGNFGPALERTLRSRGDFDGELSGADGISRYYVLSRVGAADGLMVILKIRSSDIYRQSREHLIIILTGMLFVTASVFGVAWITSDRYVARPLTRLGAIADLFAEGNLSERSGLPYQGEIGRLAQSFDLMAESLRREKTASAEMLEALRALTGRFASVSELERAHIAREIHDELGQLLTAMRFELARLEAVVHPEHRGKVQDLVALLEAATREVRQVATKLRPVALDTGGLGGAVENLAADLERRRGVSCRVRMADIIEPPGPTATCLYRICQESLTNIGRHAGATEAEVCLTEEDGWLTLQVRDNGSGFHNDASAPATSLGILGMRERARIAGGSLDVSTAPGKGTIIVARVPVTVA